MKPKFATYCKSRPASSPAAAVQPPEIDFHGASIINERGEEIPITEKMVQQACKIFIQQWETAHKNTVKD